MLYPGSTLVHHRVEAIPDSRRMGEHREVGKATVSKAIMATGNRVEDMDRSRRRAEE